MERSSSPFEPHQQAMQRTCILMPAIFHPLDHPTISHRFLSSLFLYHRKRHFSGKSRLIASPNFRRKLLIHKSKLVIPLSTHSWKLKFKFPLSTHSWKLKFKFPLSKHSRKLKFPLDIPSRKLNLLSHTKLKARAQEVSLERLFHSDKVQRAITFPKHHPTSLSIAVPFCLPNHTAFRPAKIAEQSDIGRLDYSLRILSYMDWDRQDGGHHDPWGSCSSIPRTQYNWDSRSLTILSKFHSSMCQQSAPKGYANEYLSPVITEWYLLHKHYRTPRIADEVFSTPKSSQLPRNSNASDWCPGRMWAKLLFRR